ncbi:MAG: hypothetical protein WC480_04220 [Patescibacteria group bacterium]
MKKNFAISFLMVALALVLVGCGKQQTQEAKILDTAQNIQDLAKVADQAQKAGETGSPEDLAKMIQNYAEVAANMELQEFERTEAVDAPSSFPKELIYSNGKIVAASDNSDESYIDQDITLKTTDDAQKVKTYYKDLFSQPSWKITSQSTEGDSANFKAQKVGTNLTADVDISFNQVGSKLVEVVVYYSGDTGSTN